MKSPSDLGRTFADADDTAAGSVSGSVGPVGPIPHPLDPAGPGRAGVRKSRLPSAPTTSYSSFSADFDSGQQRSPSTLLHIGSGLPTDLTDREFHAMFTFAPGFERAILKRRSSFVGCLGYAVFRSYDYAMQAKAHLEHVRPFDSDLLVTLSHGGSGSGGGISPPVSTSPQRSLSFLSSSVLSNATTATTTSSSGGHAPTPTTSQATPNTMPATSQHPQQTRESSRYMSNFTSSLASAPPSATSSSSFFGGTGGSPQATSTSTSPPTGQHAAQHNSHQWGSQPFLYDEHTGSAWKTRDPPTGSSGNSTTGSSTGISRGFHGLSIQPVPPTAPLAASLISPNVPLTPTYSGSGGVSANGPGSAPIGPSGNRYVGGGAEDDGDGDVQKVVSPTLGPLLSSSSSSSVSLQPSNGRSMTPALYTPPSAGSASGAAGGGSGNVGLAAHRIATVNSNPADQNPPCNTVYVGNLPLSTSEDELKVIFSQQRGYRRLCFRTKSNGPMCFVEFEDIGYATNAIHSLQGYMLSNSIKGGIRLSFSKNPLGVRSSNGTGASHTSDGSSGPGAGKLGAGGQPLSIQTNLPLAGYIPKMPSATASQISSASPTSPFGGPPPGLQPATQPQPSFGYKHQHHHHHHHHHHHQRQAHQSGNHQMQGISAGGISDRAQSPTLFSPPQGSTAFGASSRNAMPSNSIIGMVTSPTKPLHLGHEGPSPPKTMANGGDASLSPTALSAGVGMDAFKAFRP